MNFLVFLCLISALPSLFIVGFVARVIWNALVLGSRAADEVIANLLEDKA